MLLCIAVAAALFFYQQTSYVSDRRQLDVSGRPPSVRASRTAQPRIRPPVGPRTSGVNSASVDVSGPFDALEPPQLSLSPPVSGVELLGVRGTAHGLARLNRTAGDRPQWRRAI